MKENPSQFAVIGLGRFGSALAKRLYTLGKEVLALDADAERVNAVAPFVTHAAILDSTDEKALKEVGLPVQLHTHYTSGAASMTYLKAIEAGCDIVDCAISPLALGTSQPPTEPFVASLRGTEYDTGLDLDILNQIADYFKPIREQYLSSGLLDAKVMGVDVNALIYQVPGGMLSNLVSQLKQAGKSDQYDEVLREVPRVREDFGYPPLVTPTSQIVGTQSVMNVISGERYKMVPKESKALVKGEYGKTPAPIPQNVKDIILKGEETITCRPADLIEPELDKIRVEMKEYLEQDEDVLSYALFPQVAETFFKYRRAQKYKIDSGLVNLQDKTHPV